jgi:biotin carboxylase
MTVPKRLLLVHPKASLPWLFEAAVRQGIDLVVIPRPGDPMGTPPPGVVEILDIDAEDVESVLAAHAHTPFDGVLTPYEATVPLVAELAERMSLPGLSKEAALNARDKRRMRAALAESGCHTPGFVRLGGPDEEADFSALTFPVVVKPANGLSSIGVTRVDTPAELPRAMAEVWEISGRLLDEDVELSGLVVEEYLDGPEYAVECLVVDGTVHVLCIGYKGFPQGPYFEEEVYIAPVRLEQAVEDAVVQEVVRGHRSLGITTGATHSELRLCADGRRPFLLEIGARFGGSGASHYMAEGASGVDFAGEAFRIAVGLPPQGLAGTKPDGLAPAVGVAANYIVQCGGQGVITEITGMAEVAADPRVDQVIEMLHPGDVVRPYPDFTGYPAFVLSRHDDYESAEELHDFIAATVTISYRPEEEGR